METKHYHVEGFGREVGALGIREHFCIGIEAESEKEAFEKLYAQYENITLSPSSHLQFRPPAPFRNQKGKETRP